MFNDPGIDVNLIQMNYLNKELMKKNLNLKGINTNLTETIGDYKNFNW